MPKMKTLFLGVLVALPIVVAGMLCLIYPNNESILEIASAIGFAWECMVLLLWYLAWKRNKKSE